LQHINRADIKFETKDFRGRKITCTRVRWIDHIAENSHHAYMDGLEDYVIEAINNPHNGYRCYDRAYKNRRVYYKYYEAWDEYLKVVVEFEDNKCEGEGFVCTAYQQSEKTRGERPEL